MGLNLSGPAALWGLRPLSNFSISQASSHVQVSSNGSLSRLGKELMFSAFD